MPRVRRSFVGHLALFLRLIWPGLVVIVVVNTLLGWTGSPPASLWLIEPLAIVAMLGVAWQRDRQASRKVVELHRYPTAVVHVYRGGRKVDTIVFAGRPNPLEHLPDEAPSLALASAAIIEFVAGDIDVARLESDLDFYLRNVRPPADTQQDGSPRRRNTGD